MRILRILLLLLTNSIFCFNARACGGWEEYETYFRLFEPKYMISGREFASITFNDEPWSNVSTWYPQENEHEENLKLWKAYFPVYFMGKDLKQLVYKLSAEDLIAAKNNPKQAGYEVLKWVIANDAEVLDYLVFAKECEKHCNPRPVYYWEEPEEKDLTVYEAFIKKGKKRFQNCSNEFLKERYAFQLIKLMRHAERYDECLGFWKDELADNTKSIMYYWTLDHVAGVQIKKGLKTDGWKNFMEVFLHSPGKRFSTYCSVKIKSDEEWRALLNACETDKQKETMYFMRASQLGSVALADIDSLNRINPKSEFLPILVCREINKIESIFLQSDENENVFYQQYFNRKDINSELNAYLAKVNAFLEEKVSEKGIGNKAFWQISYLYSSFLMQNFEQVRKQLKVLPANLSDDFAAQVQIIKDLLLITDRSKSPIERQNLMEGIQGEVQNFAYLFMCHPSNELPYPLNVNERMYELRTNLNTEKLEALVDLAKRQDELSWYANYILKTHYSNKLEYLKEMLGTSYLADEEVGKALEVFSGISEEYIIRSESFYLSYNPFNYLINDLCSSTLDEIRYSKLKFAKTLNSITNAIEEGNATAMDYYLLANAQYNTSYFGYAWNAKAFYWSGGYYSANFDCTKAHQNYLKAAELSDDREMQAKCYYLAAKANQNMYLIDHKEYSYIKSDLKEVEMRSRGYRNEFKKLKEEYEDTKFYDRIIEECKYFQFYVD